MKKLHVGAYIKLTVWQQNTSEFPSVFIVSLSAKFSLWLLDSFWYRRETETNSKIGLLKSVSMFVNRELKQATFLSHETKN